MSPLTGRLLCGNARTFVDDVLPLIPAARHPPLVLRLHRSGKIGRDGAKQLPNGHFFRRQRHLVSEHSEAAVAGTVVQRDDIPVARLLRVAKIGLLNTGRFHESHMHETKDTPRVRQAGERPSCLVANHPATMRAVP